MSLALASLAVQAGNSYSVNVGSTSTVGAVVVLNESPYGLNVSNGSSSQWIAAQTADLVPCDAMGFNGTLTIRTDSYLDNASTAPSFLVYFTAFAPGEAIRGTYPSPLARMSNVGNIVTTNATTPNSLEQDIITPFVLSGLTAAKDGTTANRLDVASGVALVRQPDSSIGRVAPSATNFTTAQINSTYYLFLNPDGTYSWQLSSTPPTNALAICHATTDASGNISAVTDDRVLHTELFGAGEGGSGTGGNGGVDVTQLNFLTGLAGAFPNNVAQIGFLNAGAVNDTFFNPPTISGKAAGWYFATYTGSATVIPFQIGQTVANASTQISDSGSITQLASQATAGSLGVPVTVAMNNTSVHITTTGFTTLLTYTPPTTGWYRVNIDYFSANTGVTLTVSYTEAMSGANHAASQGNTPDTSVSLPIFALGGQAIAAGYLTSFATPNDYARVIIERLS